MKLYSFFNSSASYRVRIALALKGINYQTEGVNIRIGQQNELAYRRMNPVGLVPTLLTDEGESLGQSLAIIDWLERHYPQVLLVPQEEPARNKVLEIVYAIACDIHPLNNLRVLRYLIEELNVSEEEKKRWYAHWIQQGLSARWNNCCARTSRGNFVWARRRRWQIAALSRSGQTRYA